MEKRGSRIVSSVLSSHNPFQASRSSTGKAQLKHVFTSQIRGYALCSRPLPKAPSLSATAHCTPLGVSALSHAQPFIHGQTVVPAHPYSIKSYACEVSAIRRVFQAHSLPGQDRSFLVSDVGVVERQYQRWSSQLPQVEPFYAIKCNPDTALLKTLYACGSGFDVASASEMEAALALGVEAKDIILANPIKSVRDLQFAHRVGVKQMTFDNVDELYKIKEHCPNALLVLRLKPDDSGSTMRFGIKFGAPHEHVPHLVFLASSLGLKVIGTSFHIGSGCFDAQSYEKAITLSRTVFDLAEKMGLPRFTFLDLGGGFPGNPRANEDSGLTPSFEKFACVIREALNRSFPTHSHGHVRIIAEPGRYMATAYSTLFIHVQGKREEPMSSEKCGPRKFLYYVNDGVYGSFNCILFDHAVPQPVPAYRFLKDRVSLDYLEKVASVTLSPSSELSYISARGMHSNATRDANCVGTFFGPTCDSMDVIAKDYHMEELFVGDWLAFADMGAYTNAAATTFNGMPKPQIFHVRSKSASPFMSNDLEGSS